MVDVFSYSDLLVLGMDELKTIVRKDQSFRDVYMQSGNFGLRFLSLFAFKDCLN